jgi:hypothetical protein
MFNAQAGQDAFIVNVLKEKKNGFFLEIGSNHPININNTYTLEKNFGWKGIMVEYVSSYLPSYKTLRPNSIHIISDATKVNYKHTFEVNKMPLNMDYLQIDLEVNNRSTLTTLEMIDSQLLDTYKFATITFEHDIYTGNHFNTREISRQIFHKRGYIPVFQDVCNGETRFVFEDWYVHPDLVDMDHVNKIIDMNLKHYGPNPITQKCIVAQSIHY